MDLGAVIIIMIIGVILVLVFYMIGLYSRIIDAKNKVEDKFVQIDTEIKNGVDMIPNLVEVVNKDVKHEENILNEMINARNAMLRADDINSKIKASNSINTVLNKIFALSETYSELKLDNDFILLKKDLNKIKDKINYAKSFYNDTALEYNNLIIKIPFNIVASMFGFEKFDYFNLDRSGNNCK